MTQSNPQLPNENTTGVGNGSRDNRRGRVEGRDYHLQPSATVALLPAIAEERQTNGVPYHKSISMIETGSKFLASDPFNDKTEASYFLI